MKYMLTLLFVFCIACAPKFTQDLQDALDSHVGQHVTTFYADYQPETESNYTTRVYGFGSGEITQRQDGGCDYKHMYTFSLYSQKYVIIHTDEDRIITGYDWGVEDSGLRRR